MQFTDSQKADIVTTTLKSAGPLRLSDVSLPSGKSFDASKALLHKNNIMFSGHPAPFAGGKWRMLVNEWTPKVESFLSVDIFVDRILKDRRHAAHEMFFMIHGYYTAAFVSPLDTVVATPRFWILTDWWFREQVTDDSTVALTCCFAIESKADD